MTVRGRGVKLAAAVAAVLVLAACSSGSTKSSSSTSTAAPGSSSTDSAGPSAAQSSSTESTPASAAASSISAASTTPAASAAGPHKYKFGVIGALVHPFYGPMPGALKDAAAKYGISPVPTFTTPQTVDQVQQNTIIDGYVSQGYNGIAVQLDDAVAGNAELTRVAAQGVHVVEIANCTAQPTPAPLCLTTNNVQLGTAASDDLAKVLNDKGNVVLLAGQPGDANTAIYVNAVKAALAKYPGMHLTQVLTGMDELQAAQTAIGSLFASKASQIDGIISTSGVATPLLAQKLQQLNNTRIKAIGLNTFPQATLDAIQGGFLYGTMAQNPYGMAYLAAYSLQLLVNGCTWTGPAPPQYVDAGTFLVTKDNVASQAQKLADLTSQLASTWKDKYFKCPAGT